MAVTVSVKASVKIDGGMRRALENMQPARMRAFLERQGENMATQARKNIVRFGTRANNTWPRLSAPYAKRKKDGKTPGRGSHNYAMLRDTGSMYDGLVGRVESRGSGWWRVVLDSDGQLAGRPSNSDLLMFHHTGAGNLPQRSPVQDMTLFERRFADSLRKFLGGAVTTG